MTSQTSEKALELITYDPACQPDFYRLNAAWIAPNFGLEEEDVQFLQNPESEIITKGGMVFFARLDGVVVGTCGLFKMDDTTYELIRMAVDSNYRGLKIGEKLLLYAIEWTRQQNAAQVILESSSQPVNAAALKMYEKHGFRDYQPQPKHRSALARADVFMQLPLT